MRLDWPKRWEHVVNAVVPYRESVMRQRTHRYHFVAFVAGALAVMWLGFAAPASAEPVTIDDAGLSGAEPPAIAVNGDGNPVIASGEGLYVCADPACSEADLAVVVSGMRGPDLAVTSDGNPVLSYLEDKVGVEARILICATPDCAVWTDTEL